MNPYITRDPKITIFKDSVNVGIGSAFLAISVCSVAGWLASSAETENDHIGTLVLDLLKVIGTGLRAYVAEHLGLYGGIWVIGS